MASAIDSGVDTGNDSNDSCVQDKKMDVDQSLPNTSTSVVLKEPSSRQDGREVNQIKHLRELIIPNGDFPPRVSFLHLQPSSLSHGYEVTPLQKIGKCIIQDLGSDGEYKNGVLLRKMKTVKCRLRSSTCYSLNASQIFYQKRLRRRALDDSSSAFDFSLTSTSKIERDSNRMCRAACMNNVDLVREMLENGVTPNCYDCFQRTPLHIASCMGFKEMVALLLMHGADPNAKDRIGNTPLHLAACTNHIEVITLLLKAGSNVLEKDLAGHSPIHFAVTKFNIMSRSQCPVKRHKVCQVITMLSEYVRVKDASAVDNDLLVKFENLLKKSTGNEQDTGEKELLNTLSSLSISSST